jgi:hypothetical protein
MNKKLFGSFAYQMLISCDETSVARWVREVAHPLTGDKSDFDPLMELIGNAHFIMISVDTHGTDEFSLRLFNNQ